MRRRMTRARWRLAGAIVVLATAVFASSVVAGQFRSQDPSSFRADLATGAVTRVADIPAADGLPGRGVFAQVTAGGQFCLWDAVSAGSSLKQGGCNPVSDPLGGSALSASLAYEGGPDVERVRDARLVGLASPEVARVEVLMSDGTHRAVRSETASVGSRTFLTFGYRIRASDLRSGIGPTAVIAWDTRGVEVARQPTGIGP